MHYPHSIELVRLVLLSSRDFCLIFLVLSLQHLGLGHIRAVDERCLRLGGVISLESLEKPWSSSLEYSDREDY